MVGKPHFLQCLNQTALLKTVSFITASLIGTTWFLAVYSRESHSGQINVPFLGKLILALVMHSSSLCPQISSVQLFSRVRLFATPWIAAHQASLSITNSQSSLRLTSIELVMPSSHLILCHPLFLPPPIPQSLFQWVNSSHEVAKILEFQL